MREEMDLHSEYIAESKYRADIDGLRAIAVLLVIGFHAFPFYFKGGFIGVDIFFVLSGYLITRIILEDLEQDRFSLARFYDRRIRRIFPALLTVLLACLVFGWFALLPDEDKQLGTQVTGGAAFAANLVFWKESGYFDTSAETKPLLHLWSLGIEEQFYVVWPLLLWFCWKRRFSLPAVLASVATLSFLLNLIGIRQNPIATFYSPQTRFWELTIGAWLAYMSLSKPAALSRLLLGSNNLRSACGAALIAVGVISVHKESAFPGWLALMPTLGAMLILSAGAQAWINHKILSRPLLVWIGLISYPLYLWHWPLLSFARTVESATPTPLIRLTAVLVAVVLSWLTYSLVEKPVRYGGSGALRPISLLVLMAGIGVFGWTVHDTGNKNPSQDKDNIVQLSWPESLNHKADCIAKFGARFSEYCVVDNVSKVSEIVLLGDSQADQLYYGLNRTLAGKNVLLLGKGGCAPLLGVTTRLGEGELDCGAVVAPAIEYAISADSVRTVVLSMMGPAYVDGKRSLRGGSLDFHRIGRDDETDRARAFEQSMEQTLSRLVVAKKHVVFVMATPRLDFLPAACIARPFRITPTRRPCGVSRETVDLDGSKFRSIAFAVLKKFPEVTVFDSFAALCDQDRCWAMKDGTLLYRDDVHLSQAGSEFLSQRLASLLVFDD